MGMIEIPIERREPVMRWIPNWMHDGHEPEENDEYLVTWIGYLGNKITKPMLSICEYNDGWITEDIEEYGYNNVMIHAYMPLPEPYKGGDDE